MQCTYFGGHFFWYIWPSTESGKALRTALSKRHRARTKWCGCQKFSQLIVEGNGASTESKAVAPAVHWSFVSHADVLGPRLLRQRLFPRRRCGAGTKAQMVSVVVFLVGHHTSAPPLSSPSDRTRWFPLRCVVSCIVRCTGSARSSDRRADPSIGELVRDDHARSDGDLTEASIIARLSAKRDNEMFNRSTGYVR